MSHNLNLKLQHCDLAREKKNLTEEEYTIAREKNPNGREYTIARK